MTTPCFSKWTPNSSKFQFLDLSLFQQYMPLKPTSKWGIKVWVMADSSTGYAGNLQIYTGKEDQAEKGLASRVVKDLMTDYQDLGHHLYVDNFYTSLSLLKDLLEAGTLACGIIRSNRKGFPAVLKDNINILKDNINIPGKNSV